ncbi:TAP-like protein-domain-containing protein [Chaetomium tenue]|uniref:TAP-like protein-domain-containing protein n=1 Tax=Chaetomium tenue TaxID=1854479 RepID=A0ACB7PEM7_9PEZI|nr:TAP-like protein-domain-containing protein [Chaetomium globosum]
MGRQSSPSWTFWSTTLLLTSLTTPTTAFHTADTHPLLPRQLEPDTFDWSTITPTPSLHYHPCYNHTFRCARLQVPLDWRHPDTAEDDDGPHAALAIITLPATVPATDPAYGGPVLINGGGPAGPNAEGSLIRPGCGTMIWSGSIRAGCGGPRRRRGVAELCERVAGEEGENSVFNHMSTASVARDMLEVVEKSHELLVKEGNGTGKACGGGEEPKLQYLGLSYGSILGSTFASMFPDRVGRMVVDGIADAEDFNLGQRAKNINDAEDAVDALYRTCFDAGELCPLYQTTDTSAASIRARVDALIQDLEENPVPAIHNGRVYLVTSLFIREEIRQSLYTPIPKFDPLSRSLAGALAGNFSLILSNPAVLGTDTRPAVCTEPPSTSPSDAFTNSFEANLGIACGDSQALAGDRTDPAWAAATVARIANQAPLLILSSRTDHVTPLANAHRLSSLHGGSAVVVQESVGHGALISAVSQCTWELVRAYFRTGAVPRNGTVCEADCRPHIPYRGCEGLVPAV